MRRQWEFTTMKTLTVDAHKRIRLAESKPGQVYSAHPNPDGSVLLVPVREVTKERFPRGSLLKYFTGELGQERNKRDLEILSGCVQGPQGTE